MLNCRSHLEEATSVPVYSHPAICKQVVQLTEYYIQLNGWQFIYFHDNQDLFMCSWFQIPGLLFDWQVVNFYTSG